jgi:DNA (cytosine-5)-methyltransferase 1
VENVSALLGRGMGRVLGDLSSLGYDAEWSTLRASDVGAPHRRDRVFIVAYARRVDSERRGVADELESAERSGASERPERQRDGHAIGGCRSTLADGYRERCEQFGLGWLSECAGRAPGGRDADRRDRARLGDTDGSRLEERRDERGNAEPKRSPTVGAGPLADSRCDATEPDGQFAVGRSPESCVGRSPDGVSGRMVRWPAGPQEAQHDWEPPRLVPKLSRAERSAGPDAQENRARRLKALGNAVVPQCAEVVGRVVLQIVAREGLDAEGYRVGTA